ncbi:DUF2914 domain-containing protein [Agarivorans sp. MS3-6]
MAEQVRIKIQVNSVATPQQSSVNKVLAPKPPFDLGKIFAALSILILLVGVLIYRFWPAESPSSRLIAAPNEVAIDDSSSSAPLETTAISLPVPEQTHPQPNSIEKASSKAVLDPQALNQATAQASSDTPALAQTNPNQATSETTTLSQASATQAASETTTLSQASATQPATETTTLSQASATQATSETTSLSQASATQAASETPSLSQASATQTAPETTSLSQASAIQVVSDEQRSSEVNTSEQLLITEESERLTTEPTLAKQAPRWIDQQLPRAQLTSGISRREPLDTLTRITLSEQNVAYLFLELRGMQGQQVQVHWYQGQQLRASVDLAIGGQRWRTNSSKQFDMSSRGNWRVSVVNQQQKLIFEQEFTVD